MKPYISVSLRERVALQARYRCGYCLRSEELAGMPMTIDHIIPTGAGGSNKEDNLWLACRRCNEFKGFQTQNTDSDTGRVVKLFNPRKQKWNKHFAWSDDGTKIIGKTPCGRATVTALKINAPEIVGTRKLWCSVGWWPPQN